MIRDKTQILSMLTKIMTVTPSEELQRFIRHYLINYQEQGISENVIINKLKINVDELFETIDELDRNYGKWAFVSYDGLLVKISALGQPTVEDLRAVAFAPRQKKYIVTSPSGEKFYTDNLSEFSREHGITQQELAKVARGRITHTKGWRAWKG